MKNRVIRNINSMLIAVSITQLTGFFVTVYLARILGPLGFGKIGFALAFISYFLILGDFGFSILGVRELSKIRSDKNSAQEFISSILTLKFIASFCSLALLLLISSYLKIGSDLKILIALYGFSILASLTLFEWIFQAIEKMHFIALSRLISGSINCILVLLVISNIERIFYIPVILLISYVSACAFLVVAILKLFPLLKPTFNKKILFANFKLALPLGLSLFMTQIYNSTDIVLLGFIKGNEAIGYYSAAFRIIFALTILVVTCHDAIFPIMAEAYKKSFENLKLFLEKILKATLIYFLPLVLILMLTAKQIINICFGRDYAPSINIFQMLLCGLFIIGVNLVFSRGLIAANKEKDYLKGTMLTALISMALYALLIPIFGRIGAAFGRIGAETYFLFYCFRKFNKIK